MCDVSSQGSDTQGTGVTAAILAYVTATETEELVDFQTGLQELVGNMS
jgi:hypothetical protein